MDTPFLTQPLLTCIGNKRKLLEPIAEVVTEVARRLGKNKLRLVDACTGSGIVARRLLPLAEELYINDLEYYAYIMAQCFFIPPTAIQEKAVRKHFARMSELAQCGPYVAGIITRGYAPQDTHNVKAGERCFYTHENALILDTLRTYIDREVPVELRNYCLAPLLIKASIHANTSGVFKGYHKKDGVGCFGGKGGNALGRILKPIAIELPIWSKENPTAHCSQIDVLALAEQLPTGLDLLYLDPPYNQHPYRSNYFMLNLLARNEVPVKISEVSGIPTDWIRSSFNYHISALDTMSKLLSALKSKCRYILISYNDEGLITPDEWQKLLAPYKHEIREIEYKTYKGCRNLNNRNVKVTELLYLVDLSGQ